MNSTDAFLGIDVGTTTTKAMLLSEDGRVLGSASCAYSLITEGIGRCEQDAMAWWNALVSTVRQVCADPAIRKSIRGISLSTQGGTVVPTDAKFQPLCNAIVWSDGRCAKEQDYAQATLGRDYVYRTCGWNLGSGLPALEIRHMRTEKPDVFHSAAYFLTVPDFIYAKLTGRPAVDYSNAGINQWLDINRGQYDPALIELSGIRENQLAPLVPSCERVGTLTAEAAEALGLSRDTIVVSGAHDQHAVALGAGICKAGDAVIGTGTAWVLTALHDASDFASGFAQTLPPTRGQWGTMLSISSAGVCLDWFRRYVAGAEGAPIDYDTINALVSGRDEPGAGGLRFYPFFNGAPVPVADNVSRAALLGLDLSHDRGHMARAIMEGVAMQMNWAVKEFEKRHPINRLFLAGGATKSDVWTRIIAEIAGRPIHVSRTSDLGCVGAAMMAAVGAGNCKDTSEATQRMNTGSFALEPDAMRVEAYRGIQESYQTGALALRDFSQKG